jgi:L-fuconolactonase
MIIVDTHCHVSPYWYEPVEALLFHMDQNSVNHAVLIQYRGQFNNSYQAECLRRFPGRFVSVVIVDTGSPQAIGELERLAGQGAQGVRLQPDTRSPGSDPLAIWRQAEALGLVVSCGGSNADFIADEFARLVQAAPNLPIIIEHLGADNRPTGETPPYPLRQKIFDLARFPNLYLKIHGLGEICERTTPVAEPFPFKQDHLPILEMAYRAFGPNRMMWGSDYPPVSGREGYRNALRWMMDQFDDEEERRLIFGGTALRLFKFEE